MIASVLPDEWIDYGTDLVFIAAVMAAIVYVMKRVIGFLKTFVAERRENGNGDT